MQKKGVQLKKNKIKGLADVSPHEVCSVLQEVICAIYS